MTPYRYITLREQPERMDAAADKRKDTAKSGVLFCCPQAGQLSFLSFFKPILRTVSSVFFSVSSKT